MTVTADLETIADPTEEDIMTVFDTINADVETDETADVCATCGETSDYLERASDAWGVSRHDLHCQDCISHCDWCDESYLYISDHTDSYCTSCEEYVCRNMAMYYCENCDDSRCENCGPCISCSQSVRSYDWNPPEFLFKTTGDADKERGVFLGVELEVEGEEGTIVNCVHETDDDERHIYMKHDGSVNGVELVAHPATLEWSRKFGYSDILDSLRSARCHINLEQNGLHVHVARSAFMASPINTVDGKKVRTAPGRRGRNGTPARSARHQMAWLMFMYRNAENLQALARRDGGQWASFRAPRSGELKGKVVRGERGDRYVAVNCNNEHTYELRFFASTLDATEFYAALEFADASVEYTRQLSTTDVLKGNGMSWKAFQAWVEAHDYPSLASEMVTQVTDVAEPTSGPKRPEPVERRTYDGCDCTLCASSRTPAVMSPIVSWLD